jgi:hypothetical protein
MDAVRLLAGVVAAFVLLVFSVVSFLVLYALSAALGPLCWSFALVPAFIVLLSIEGFLRK